MIDLTARPECKSTLFYMTIPVIQNRTSLHCHPLGIHMHATFLRNQIRCNRKTLYFINSVFISLATFIGVRVMHFQRKEFVDKTREKTVRKYIVLIVVLTMCPAVYLTFGIIKSTFYEAAANRFINDQLSFENTQVLDKKISYDHKEVRVVLIGPEVPDASISIARSKLKEYKLEDTKLIVLQGMNNEAVDVSSIRAMVMEDFYKNSEQRLQQQAVKISQLETTLEQYRTYDAIVH